MSSEASVLYDVPGPRARIRNIVISVGVLAVVGWIGWIVFSTLDEKHQLTAQKWRPFANATTWTTYIIPGLKGTLTAAALAIALALLLGAILGITRLSDHRWVRIVAGTVTEVFRATPVLILMIFIYEAYARYGVVDSKHLPLAATVTALTLYNGAVIAEIVRAGINALPKGQTEAAVAIGLRKHQTMRMILLPQAVTAMLPAILSQMVVALKDSALGYVIGLIEVVRAGQQIGSYYSNYLPALLVIAAIMIVLNSSLTLLATKLEKRLRRQKRPVEPVELWRGSDATVV